MLRKTRSEIMENFRSEVANGKILVGVGAGTGITVNVFLILKYLNLIIFKILLNKLI